MATSAKVKGFISDSEMEKISSAKTQSNKTPAFISDEEMTKLEKSSSQKKESRSGEAALEGFGEGATLGYLNNLQAATEPLTFKALNFITGKNVEADDYIKARDSYNLRQESLKKDSPGAFTAGQVGGSIVSSIPVAKAAQGATAAARVYNAAKAGAAYGGLQNTSEKEGEYTSLDRELAERTDNAKSGALIGAAAQGGGELVGQIGNKVSTVKNYVGEKIQDAAEKLAVKATGATGKQSEKFAKNAGRELLDRGVVQFGDDAEKVALRANTAIKESEDTISNSLKALDEKGVKVSTDKIVENLQNKINSLKSDPSQASVAKKLQTLVDDIYESGASNVDLSAAEVTKRGYNKIARNWQDPEQGEAGKAAYLAYRDAVEGAAKAADPKIAKEFIQAKKTYGLMNPIAEAAEKRAATLNQSPFGGLIDVATTGASGAAAGLPGLAGGVALAAGRRIVAPRVASSLAVTADKVSKQLLKSPEFAQLAQKSPDLFKSTVLGVMKEMEMSKAPQMLPAVAEQSSPVKGYEKWAADGASKVIEHDSTLSPDEIDQIKNTKKGRDLLIKASDLQPKSKAMEKIVDQIRSGSLKGDE